MSRVISFRTDDEVADTIDRVVDESDEDVSRALVTKRLVEEAVDARENPLWVRIGMSDRRAAQIEALRREGEDDADVARELLAEAIEHRHGDVLDAIGASDELRDTVEEQKEEGEPLGDAVRRLLRDGAERPRGTHRGAVMLSTIVGGLMVLSAIVSVYIGITSALLLVGVMILYTSLYPSIRPIVENWLGRTAD